MPRGYTTRSEGMHTGVVRAAQRSKRKRLGVVLNAVGWSVPFTFNRPSILTRVSRRIRVSLIMFHGKWGLPIPYDVDFTFACVL